MFHFTKKRAVVAMAVVGSLALSVGAYAYFTAAGTGEGSATAGSTTPVVITQTNALATLYPGTPQDVDLLITNPGSGSPYVGSVHLSSITADAQHSGCVVTLSGNEPAFTMADVSVNARIAHGTPISKSGSLVMNDTSFNQDTCQGATLTLHFSSN